MTSSLPKLADRAFVIGYLLPTLLFGAALLALFADAAPVRTWLATMLVQDTLEKTVYVAVAAWVLAVLLMLLSNPLYRFLEGYWGPFAWFRLFHNRETKRFEKMQAAARALEAKEERQGQLDPEDDAALNRHLRAMNEQFPLDRDLLPTRLGNAIRSFERYALSVHGADTIDLWPHMMTVIPKELDEALSFERAKADFLVNIVMMAAASTVIAVGRLLWRLAEATTVVQRVPNVAWTWGALEWWLLFAVVAGAAITWGFYHFAIGQCIVWGKVVRAAFDGYLSDVARRLGYELPVTLEQRRRFWADVGYQIVYGRPMKPELWYRSKLEE